jgi:hypothetical protein
MEEKKKLTRSTKGKPRPHTWIVAQDDPYKHSMYLPWLRSKSQARYRNEGWDLTFEQFYELWKNDWLNRGRQPENVCMVREDYDGPWDTKNTLIVTRLEHLRRQNAYQATKPNYGRPVKTQKVKK